MLTSRLVPAVLFVLAGCPSDSPSDAVTTPAGPKEPGLTVSVNVVRAKGTAYPNANGYTFGCAGGSSLGPNESPFEKTQPWLVLQADQDASDIQVDSIVIKAEHSTGITRDLRTGYNRMGRGGYIYSPFGAMSPNLPASLPLANAAFDATAVVYHHRGPDAFVSAKVSYRCEP